MMDAMLYFALTGNTLIATSHYTTLQPEIHKPANSKVRARSPLYFYDLEVECLESFSTLPGVWLGAYTVYLLLSSNKEFVHEIIGHAYSQRIWDS